ncbi:von Willebrand factor A-like domain-containing protein [Desulfonema limicola]|uniref:von Willebrand factor A-like domain-containing protein n=2 Tax=Desulfonema limicola TaxID=45656 RepID=A0A975BBT7_9BACT|nr:von Willebrand factor A-like domain-containing protein [Desulfonema limicola]
MNFMKILKDSGNADQYFFPNSISSWKNLKGGKKYQIDKGYTIKSHINGIRLHEWDVSGNNPTIEKECQYDLSKTFNSIKELRKNQEYKNLIISDDFAKTKQNTNKGKRIKLGLFIPSSNKYSNDIVAAKHCYKNIKKVIYKSGYKIDFPGEFDPSSGLDGLCEWANSVKLKRKKPWRFLLLLPFLLLLLFLIPECNDKEIFDMEINTNSFIFIIDKSSSMQSTIDEAQKEVNRVLKVLLDKQGLFSNYYVNIISYNKKSNSALGKIEELNNDTVQKLNKYLKNLKAEGDTYLESAIEKATYEVTKHNKPTTLLIVTDAEDNSIVKMVRQIDNIKEKFSNIEIYVNSTTPRILKDKDSIPKGKNEMALKTFSEQLNGKFGNSGEIK